jgi:signal transduction histidine kinase
VTDRKRTEGELQKKICELTEEVARRERTEAELRRANEMKDEFLAVASHELRTPLTTLKLNTQSFLLASDVIKDEKLRFRLLKIDRQADRLVELVNTLLDVSRLSTGEVVLERTAFDLSTLAREVTERFEEEAERSRASIAVRADVPVTGHWDRLRLEQVVSNLVGNALKFGAGRAVQVEVAEDGGQARLTVRDQGIGIDPADHARIFERFERAVPATNYSGFGVGLWIVREFVDAHGGSIRVDSAPGRGATFVVTLPRS